MVGDAVSMEVIMERRRYRWLGVLGGVLLAAVVGVVAYNAGYADGFATQVPAAAQGPQYGYRWHGGFWLGPLLLVFFWFVVARAFWWRRPRWHYRYAGVPCDMPTGVFDEWHRRAHDRMKEASAADDPGRRG
jgi:hypothetical protein